MKTKNRPFLLLQSAALAVALTGLSPLTTAQAAGDAVLVTGSGLGAGVEIRGPAGLGELEAGDVDLARAESRMADVGLAPTDLVAHARGIPARIAAPTLVDVEGGIADASVRAGDLPATDEDGLSSESLPGLGGIGGIDVQAAYAVAAATDIPLADASTFVEQADVQPLADLPFTSADNAIGSARTEQAAGPSNRLEARTVATGDVDVTRVDVGDGSLVIEVEAARTRAAATATGIDPAAIGGSSASTECQVSRVSVNGEDVPLATLPCETPPRNIMGLVVIEFGITSTNTSANTATAAATAVTITLLRDGIAETVIRLGVAEAAATIATTEQTGCAPDTPNLPGRAAASGGVMSVTTPPVQDVTTRTDSLLAEARVDESGFVSEGAERIAAGDTWVTRVREYGASGLLPEADTGTFDAHAAAPPDAFDDAITPPDTMTSNAAANGGASPAAEGVTSAVTFDLGEPLGPINGMTAQAAASDAHAGRSVGTSAADASTEITNADLGVAGTLVPLVTPVSVHLDFLRSWAAVTADGATTVADAGYVVDGLTVTTPALGEVAVAVTDDLEVPGVILIDFADGPTIDQAPDGTNAAASIVPLTITLFQAGLPTVIELGAVSASAEAPGPQPADLLVVNELDRHFHSWPGPLFSFGDSGAIAAPHQKFWVCTGVRNTGTDESATGIVVSDTVPDELRIVPEFVPTNVTVSGQSWTTQPFDLAAGAAQSVILLLEVRPGTPLGLDLTTAPTVASGSPAGTFQAPAVGVLTGHTDQQPALRVDWSHGSWNSSTRIFTANYVLVNHADAGTAKDARIDAVQLTNDVTIAIGAMPMPVGDVAPGTTEPFQVRFLVPRGVSSFNAHFREVATGADDMPYAFD